MLGELTVLVLGIMGVSQLGTTNRPPPACSGLLKGMALPASPVRVGLIRTASTYVTDALTYKGGDAFRATEMVATAVLVEHPKGALLIDTGLGSKASTQMHEGLAWWAKPMMKWENLDPAVAQLQRHRHAPVGQVILTHGHYDHANVLPDFASATLWSGPGEQQFVAAGGSAVLSAAVDTKSPSWKTVDFQGPAVGPFSRSHDFYGDGSIVLVPLPGHTPGSLGAFVTTSKGRKLFFVGDAVWNSEAIPAAKPKAALAGVVVDKDGAATLASVQLLKQVRDTMPDVTIVPAHDSKVLRELGCYPGWVQ